VKSDILADSGDCEIGGALALERSAVSDTAVDRSIDVFQRCIVDLAGTDAEIILEKRPERRLRSFHAIALMRQREYFFEDFGLVGRSSALGKARTQDVHDLARVAGVVFIGFCWLC
jgi:hypothetical protein